MNTCFMKKLLVIIVMSFSLLSCNQSSKVKGNGQSENTQSLCQAEKYKLVATQNIWTFIKLNTRNGIMSQVQYDVKGDNRGECSLNANALVPATSEFNGRFDLYPTQNIWTFILLDQENGKTWQVQWSTDAAKRMIVPMD